MLGRGLAATPRRKVRQPDMDQPLEKRAGRENDSPRGNLRAVTRHETGHGGALREQSVHRALRHVEPRLVVQSVLHRMTIELFIALDAERPHRRTLARVEHPELDAGAIRVASHFAAQRVDFLDEMAFRDPAHSRVAGHLRDFVHLHRQ